MAYSDQSCGRKAVCEFFYYRQVGEGRKRLTRPRPELPVDMKMGLYSGTGKLSPSVQPCIEKFQLAGNAEVMCETKPTVSKRNVEHHSVASPPVNGVSVPERKRVQGPIPKKLRSLSQLSPPSGPAAKAVRRCSPSVDVVCQPKASSVPPSAHRFCEAVPEARVPAAGVPGTIPSNWGACLPPFPLLRISPNVVHRCEGRPALYAPTGPGHSCGGMKNRAQSESEQADKAVRRSVDCNVDVLRQSRSDVSRSGGGFRVIPRRAPSRVAIAGSLQSLTGLKRKAFGVELPLVKRVRRTENDRPPSVGLKASELRKGEPDVKSFRVELKSDPDPVHRVRCTLKFFDQCRRYEHGLQRTGVHQGTRPDLWAMSIMDKHGLMLNEKVCTGPVPGVLVGQRFFYRAELRVVGLHSAPQSGIDTMKKGGTLIAKSIIVSGGYEDDYDHGEELVYTGEGGNDYGGSKRQVSDQILAGGNKAMVNSLKLKLCVRVVRGTTDETSPSKTVYSYDGLYDIVRHECVKGKSGFKVFKFYLIRQPNQPTLNSQTVRFHR